MADELCPLREQGPISGCATAFWVPTALPKASPIAEKLIQSIGQRDCASPLFAHTSRPWLENGTLTEALK